MPASQPSPNIRGGLFRQFILPQLFITALIGLFVLFWAGQTRRSEAHEKLRDTAASIAGLTRELNLPSTSRMAGNLATTTGYEVAFVRKESIFSSSSLDPSHKAAAQLASKNPGNIVAHKESEAIAFPTENPGEMIAVVQERRPLLTYATGNFFWPLLVGLLLAIASAFFISRSVVWPLRRLTGHLRRGNSCEPLRIPEAISRRNDEIGFLASSLEEERAELLSEQAGRQKSEHMALLGHLATGLAHEIKNPAAAILMHARNVDPATGKIITEEADQIVSLVNQWLFVAKPEAPVMKRHDFVALLNGLSERLAPLLKFHRVELDILAPLALPIHCDARRLEQVFRNLIDNSIQAMPGGGKITIHLELQNSLIQFSVEDEGPGFSDSALQHFGETFYSEREGGMGLGLSLVSNVIRAHGGSVSATNSPNGSALISGTLPTKDANHG